MLHLIRSKGDSTLAHLILLLYLLCAQDTLKALNLTGSSLNEGFVGVESWTTYQLLLTLVLNICRHLNCSVFWSGQRLSQSIWPIDVLIIIIEVLRLLLPLWVHGHLVGYGLRLQLLHNIIAGIVLCPLLARRVILLARHCTFFSRCYLLLLLRLLIFLWTNGGRCRYYGC